MMLRGSAGQANYANALEAQKRLALAEQAERVLGRHKVKGLSRQGIERAVKKLACDLDLTLRQRKGGGRKREDSRR